MRTIGADTSHWEGVTEWNRGADYLPFCYYKATDGVDFIDSQFGNNKDGCDEYGIPNSPYHWWQETQDPEEQAEHFIETVGTGYKRYIIDVEPSVTYQGIVNKLEILLNRCTVLTGIKPAIYTSANYWNGFIKPVPSWAHEYDLLVAQYAYRLNPILPIGWSIWKIWQYTDYFWFDGCNAIADGNWFNGTLQDCRDWFGNYHPYNVPPSLPPTENKLKMVSLVEGLRIRKLPNTNAEIVGSLYKGEEIDADNVDGWNAWVHHSRGWSNAAISGTKNINPK